jgi:serine/threonine protein kinase
MPKLCHRPEYEVLRLLSSGSFAQTYLVRQHPQQSEAILKMLKPARADRAFRTLARSFFAQEVRVLRTLGHHAAIPTLLTEFDEGGETGLVESFMKGISIQKTFQQNLFWSQTQLLHFLEEALSVLELVHGAGFVHCDLNPAHWIQRSSDGSLALIDFNGAQQIQTARQNSTNQSSDLGAAFVIGTAGYMAPEQIRGQAEVRSDLYALGLIAIQGVTGRSPTQLSRNAQGEICWQPLRPIRIELIDILTHLVRFHPQDRYSTATQALKEVREYAQPRWSHCLTKWWEPKQSLPQGAVQKD